MFGLGAAECIAIAVLWLLLFGAKSLPAAARSLGQTLTEFRRAVSGDS